ncbi:MAG: hypothetical protein EOP16_01990 [Pseudonocardia sp.]|nr:MAG: hypothetical protein EOP16_01990 [Pseudonocardia sp.]
MSANDLARGDCRDKARIRNSIVRPPSSAPRPELVLGGLADLGYDTLSMMLSPACLDVTLAVREDNSAVLAENSDTGVIEQLTTAYPTLLRNTPSTSAAWRG